MKLAKLVEKLPPAHKIRIGTTKGSKFVYVGTAGECCLEDLDKTTREELAAKMNGYMLGIVRGAQNKNQDMIRRRVALAREKFEAWTPLSDRKVVDKFRGIIEPESLVIIVEGTEGGIEYSPEMQKLRSCDESACRKAVEQLYKNACSDLIRAYKNMKKHGAEDIEASLSACECELLIRSDRYGLLDDPEGVIAACRMVAEGGRP